MNASHRVNDFGSVAQLTGMPHIFITGKAGHGKDSIGDYLIANYGFEKLSFSDGIRREVAAAYENSNFPVTVEWLDDRELKEAPQGRLALTFCRDADFIETALKAFEVEDRCLDNEHDTAAAKMNAPRSPRRIQQIWGTEYRRTQDANYWLNYAEHKTDFSQAKVLTSVRYQNEIDFGNRIGAVRIHVQRQNVGSAHDHITEQLLPFDSKTIVVDNAGTIKDLCCKIDSVMERLNADLKEHTSYKSRYTP